MTEKRFALVKCYNQNWGLVDKSLEDLDQLVLINTNKSSVLYLVNELNHLVDENVKLKQELRKQSKKCTQNIMAIKEENEQLKERIKTLKDTIDGLTGTIAHFDMEEILNE